jgi:hypothetical protein
MPVTYSSDHDWEKHSTFDIENLFGTNFENIEVNNCCTVSAIHVPSNDDIFTYEHTLEDSCSLLLMMITMMSMTFSVHLQYASYF